VISVAQRGRVPQFLRWHRVETPRQPDVGSRSAATMVTIILASYQPTSGNIFQKVWSDIAVSQNRCRGIGGVTSRTMPQYPSFTSSLAGSSFFRGADGEHTLEMRKHR